MKVNYKMTQRLRLFWEYDCIRVQQNKRTVDIEAWVSVWHLTLQANGGCKRTLQSKHLKPFIKMNITFRNNIDN